MKKTQLKKSTDLLGLLAGICLAIAPAHAAQITWTAQGTITSEAVIQANVSSAFNLNDTNSSLAVTTGSQTVTFVSTESGPITSNGITLTTTVANPGFMNAGILALVGAWDGPNVDPDFETVMDSFAHTQVLKPSDGEFSLSGLTVGVKYSVQLFSSDMRVGIGDIRTIRFDDGLGNSTSTVLQNTAPYFIGTFTADATSQNFRVFSDTTDTSTSGSVLNAVTLAVIPQSSFAVKITQNGPAFDFEWNSQPGKLYDLLTSLDLATPVAEWPVYNDGVTLHQGISSGGAVTTLTAVPSAAPRRFFAVREYDAPPAQ